MNFIRGMLGLVDDVWALWTIPAYMLFALMVISLFPLAGVVLLLLFIGIKSRYISFCNGVAASYSVKSDNRYENTYNPTMIDRWTKKSRGAQLDILCVVIGVSVAAIFLITKVLDSSFDMCQNTDVIPWSLIDILRTVTKPIC